MPLYKVPSGTDKQKILPRQWTLVSFEDKRVIPLAAEGWSIYGVMLRVEYPKQGSPTTLRGRLGRWPGTPKEDLTGFDDKNPLAGQTRHHYWSHFLKNEPDLEVGFMLWHDGTSPIVLDGRQFKWTRLS